MHAQAKLNLTVTFFWSESSFNDKVKRKVNVREITNKGKGRYNSFSCTSVNVSIAVSLDLYWIGSTCRITDVRTCSNIDVSTYYKSYMPVILLLVSWYNPNCTIPTKHTQTYTLLLSWYCGVLYIWDKSEYLSFHFSWNLFPHNHDHGVPSLIRGIK